MLSLRIPSRVLPRATTCRFPLATAPSRFSSTTTSTIETAPSDPADATIPPPPAPSAESTIPASAEASPTQPPHLTFRQKNRRGKTPTHPPAHHAIDTQSLPDNYFVPRTASNLLPVYESKIRGGSVSQTKIRKAEGNVRALKLLLQARLGVEEDKIRINPRNNHIDIRGKYKAQVDKILVSKGF